MSEWNTNGRLLNSQSPGELAELSSIWYNIYIVGREADKARISHMVDISGMPAHVFFLLMQKPHKNTLNFPTLYSEG